MKIVARILVIIVLIIVGGRFALNLLFFGRLTAPGMSDFATIAKQNQYIVQAICDFRADHGMLPQAMGDLVPNYLSRMPGGMVFFDGDSLDIPAAHRTRVFIIHSELDRRAGSSEAILATAHCLCRKSPRRIHHPSATTWQKHVLPSTTGALQLTQSPIEITCRNWTTCTRWARRTNFWRHVSLHRNDFRNGGDLRWWRQYWRILSRDRRPRRAFALGPEQIPVSSTGGIYVDTTVISGATTKRWRRWKMP